MADFLKELIKDIKHILDFEKNRTYGINDRFEEQAWKELEDYLNDNKKQKIYFNTQKEQSNKENILKEYANLKLTYTKDLVLVGKAYKKLIIEYHPDRYPDQKSKETANKVIKKINDSYNKIITHIKN